MQRLLAVLTAAALASCAQVPVEPAPPPAPAPVVLAAPPPVSRTVTDAIARHRRLADAARKEGDLPALAVQLQLLTVLAPDEPAYARELAATRSQMSREAREHEQAGHAALAAGDLDRAQVAMLRALALAPDDPDPARVLREIDRRRLSRIQADRAAKVSKTDDQMAMRGAARAPQAEPNDAFDIEQAIEIFRAGDATAGLRDMKAYVDAHPGNRAMRQRIGTVVAERARELEDQGKREPALDLYEQATLLRGDGNGAWAKRVPPLRKALSQDYYERGTRAYRTNLVQAIGFFETSVRYDPANAQASLKLKEAKAVREKLDKIK
jgi:tetratricopeptide (TPR) repeat protein